MINFTCSSQDIQNMSRSREPAEKLVLELSARLCTIEFFCSILEECGLYNILALFKGHGKCWDNLDLFLLTQYQLVINF